MRSEGTPPLPSAKSMYKSECPSIAISTCFVHFLCAIVRSPKFDQRDATRGALDGRNLRRHLRARLRQPGIGGAREREISCIGAPALHPPQGAVHQSLPRATLLRTSTGNHVLYGERLWTVRFYVYTYLGLCVHVLLCPRATHRSPGNATGTPGGVTLRVGHARNWGNGSFADDDQINFGRGTS